MKVVVFLPNGDKVPYEPAQPTFDHTTGTVAVDYFGGSPPVVYEPGAWVKAVVHPNGEVEE